MEIETKTMVLTVAEAAKLLRLSKNSVYAAVKTGDIPSIKIGKRVLIPRAALEKLLSACSVANK